MPEKTLIDNKRIILLHSFSAICVVAVLLSCMVFPIGASPLNYLDYEKYVTVDGENELVTVEFPLDNCYIQQYVNGKLEYESMTSEFWFNAILTHTYKFQIMPLGPRGISDYGLDLTNIPNGTVVTIGFSVDCDLHATPIPFGYAGFYIYNSAGAYIGYQGEDISDINCFGDLNSVSFVYNKSSADAYSSPVLDISGIAHICADCSEVLLTQLKVTSCTMVFSISSLYRLQQQTGETNALLDEVNRQLEEQGKTMEEVLNQQEQTNEKLDQLPGQIGDEMQGIVDNEKQEAESSGNDFVDQILGALPDPSTDVLAALKSLTDATAYTGTEAVLPIPAIVLPGIDGLFPETVIWEGTEFDFGEYLGFIPSSLLTLVQSLFTIAIVLFCVYELKGIISYCLTLRESKGG